MCRPLFVTSRLLARAQVSGVDGHQSAGRAVGGRPVGGDRGVVVPAYVNLRLVLAAPADTEHERNQGDSVSQSHDGRAYTSGLGLLVDSSVWVIGGPSVPFAKV